MKDKFEKKELVFNEDEIRHIKNLLKSTVGYKLTPLAFQSWHNSLEFGYHSFQIGNLKITAQRNPVERLNNIRKYIDFTDKTVIDLGCNVGGMILHLNEIRRGLGFDYDKKAIKVANKLSNIFQSQCTFQSADLNRFSFSRIPSNVDFSETIIFLFSLGSWIKNWRRLYKKAHLTGSLIVLEVNNPIEGAAQIKFFKELGRSLILISNKSKDDITGNENRQTYIVYAPNKMIRKKKVKELPDKISWEKIYVRHKFNIINKTIKKVISDSIYIAPYHYSKIYDSIQFQAISKNSFDDYLEYLNSISDYTHSPNKFMNMKEAFSIEYMNKIKIANFGSSFYILDGVHRFTLLYLSKLYEVEIPSKYFELLSEYEYHLKNKNNFRKLIVKLLKIIRKSLKSIYYQIINGSKF